MKKIFFFILFFNIFIKSIFAQELLPLKNKNSISFRLPSNVLLWNKVYDTENIHKVYQSRYLFLKIKMKKCDFQQFPILVKYSSDKNFFSYNNPSNFYYLSPIIKNYSLKILEFNINKDNFYFKELVFDELFKNCIESVKIEKTNKEKSLSLIIPVSLRKTNIYPNTQNFFFNKKPLFSELLDNRFTIYNENISVNNLIYSNFINQPFLNEITFQNKIYFLCKGDNFSFFEKDIANRKIICSNNVDIAKKINLFLKKNTIIQIKGQLKNGKLFLVLQRKNGETIIDVVPLNRGSIDELIYVPTDDFYNITLFSYSSKYNYPYLNFNLSFLVHNQK